MNVVDWHPDELFDKRERGTLSAAERRRLDEHLARCAACRLEELWREDFSAELEAEEEAAGASLAHLVQAATAEPAPRRRPRAIALAGALLLAAGTAAALQSARRAAVAVQPAIEAAGERAAEQASDAAGRAERPAKPPVEKEAKPADRTDESHVPTAAPDAAALFSAANQARRRGDRAEAVRLYRELQRLHPQSPEAQLSHATLGKLLLDEGDPDAALSAFDRYLDHGEANLSEEALVGRAVALQKLGRASEERAAWQALLRAHPSSMHAARARARLAALGGE